jgi:hypothetical protein
MIWTVDQPRELMVKAENHRLVSECCCTCFDPSSAEAVLAPGERDCEINTTYELMGIFRSRPRREASRAIAITERAAGPRSVSLRTSTLGQLEPLIWN